MDMTDACYRIAVEQRIRVLFASRHRLHDFYQQDRAELYALLRIAREARRGAELAARSFEADVRRVEYALWPA